MKGRSVLLGLTLVAATVGMYLPVVLHGGFLAYDDPQTVLRNPFVTNASLAGLGDLFTHRIFLTWLPLYFLSLWIDHLVFGLRAWGYHLSSLLLHVANAFLVLALARRIIGRRDVAWAAAFLFALHPAMTESVAWISERKGLVAFLLAGLSFLVYLRALDATGVARTRRHAAGVVLLGLAMLAKGTVLVLPAILLLHALALRGGERGPRPKLALVPYFVVAGALAVVHYVIAVQEGPALAAAAGSSLLTPIPVLAGYLRLLFAPVSDQSILHEIPVPASFLEMYVLYGALALAAAAALLVVTWRRSRPLFFALAAAVVALAPFNTVFPRTTVLFAERYLYLPALGACLAIALAAARTRRPWIPLTAVVLAFGALGVARARVWADPVAPFADADRKGGSWLTAVKLGEALVREGRYEEAAGALARAASIATTPEDEVHARLTRARALLPLSRPEEVLSTLERAGKLEASLPPAQADVAAHDAGMMRGAALTELGRDEEALEAYRAAARAVPTDAAAQAGLATALARTGRLPEAVEAGREAFRLDPADESAAVALAESLYLSGDPAGARKILDDHLERSPGGVRALCLAGELELVLGRPEYAGRRFQAALAAEPGLRRARVGLAEADLLRARAALERGDRETARHLAELAGKRVPDDPGPLRFLAGLTTDASEAERLLARAGALPGGGPAREALAALRVQGALSRLDQGDEAGGIRLAAAAVAAGSDAIRMGARREVRPELPLLRAVAADAPGRDDLLAGLVRFLGDDLAAAETRLSDAHRAAVMAGGGDDVAFLALMLRGRTRLAKGYLAGALDDFSVATEMRPGDPWPAIRTSEALFEGAVKEKNKAIEGGGTADVTLLFAGAREAAERALALSPGLLEAELRRGEIEFASGRDLEALKIFNRVKREHPDRIEPMLDLASLYRKHYLVSEQKKFLREAESELRRALAVEPENARVRASLGEILLLSGRPNQAAGELARALAADPSLDSARKALASLYVRAGRGQLDQGGPEGLEKAKQWAERALALDAKVAGPQLLLADYHRRRKDFGPAQVALEEARRLEPDAPGLADATAEFYRDLGYALLLKGRKDEALASFRKAVDAGSEKVDLHPVRVLLGLEEPEETGPPLDPRVAKLLAERTEEAKARFEEAAEHLKAGELDDALGAAKASLAARASAEGWYLLGLVQQGRKDDDAAESAYAWAVKLKPGFAGAWLNLGSLRYRRHDDAGALEAYDAYLRHAGDDEPAATKERVRALVEQLRK